MPKTIRWGAVSITGQFRENNEDRCFVDPEGRYFLVADGMGGQQAGEKASEMAIELVAKKLEQALDFTRSTLPKASKAIDAAVTFANSEIMALSEIDPEFHQMGTTLVFFVRIRDQVLIGGIGDSRVYLVRGGAVQQVTKDHSLAQALVDAGTIRPEDALKHRYRSMLYRYLGCKEGSAGTNAQPVELRSGDRFLLCSDGASEGLSDQQLINLLTLEADPQKAAESVVSQAEANGSKDNITCVTIFCD